MNYRKHAMISIIHVNPIYINSVEQIHMVCGSPNAKPMANPTNHDLLYELSNQFRECQRFDAGRRYAGSVWSSTSVCGMIGGYFCQPGMVSHRRNSRRRRSGSE